MAVELKKTFGKQANSNANANADKVKSNFWLNVGYEVEVDGEEGVEKMFVSLPQGLALDTMPKQEINSRNDDFRALQTARNDLLDQILAAAEKLQPGEDMMINLQLQVRRVNEEKAPIKSSENKFAKQLTF